ncbi:AI-2E family transporter [Chitinophagaceae bacterium LB-8]|uniref:AI-2E family transporter n=1 Tax=Paraflavisolibacter caeni TaxID=2982496 RepID=A0A9X3BA83_9BACT|nr:AI-2E family transporter [Paraflavisolibacter caeni]MCU7552321.1 AI-2E family transporter [Paraflavisolibacter caeni]
MESIQHNSLFKLLVRIVVLVAAITVLLWILFKAASMVLILILAFVLALIINAPVSYLEQRGMKRVWASITVFGIIFLVIVFLSLLTLPKIYYQLEQLILDLPAYINNLSTNIASWFEDYPEISRKIKENTNDLSIWLPSMPQTIRSISSYSLSLLSFLFLMIIFTWIIIFSVMNPRPLLKTYYSFWPIERREKAQNALLHTSTMLQGWVRSNLIGGSIQAVCTTIFLSLLHVPGAWVWGAVTLFSQLIPNIGFYIMSIPPVLVAFSVHPLKALWVGIFFIALSELMGNIILPRIRSRTMNLHPVSTLIMLLILGSAFGLWGAFLTVPITAIIKAYYEEFYLKKMEADNHLEERIDNIVYHSTDR